MAGEVAAKRHAQAVFEIAVERNELDKWRSDLDLMAGVFGDNELLPLLESPKIRFEDKADVVVKNLAGIGDMAINLLDATFVINYLYKDGPEPDPINVADCDGSGNINILDVSYLVNYLYKDGPEPVC